MPLKAPSQFSLIEGPEEALEYLDDVRSELRYRSVSAHLADVQHITPDALLALVTYADGRSRTGHGLYGNLPTGRTPREVVQNCGFDRLVSGLRPGLGLARTHRMRAARGHRVNPAETAAIVREACEKARLPYHKTSYSNLIECMTNTNNHAGNDEGSIAWRLMASCDPDRRRAVFTFMDPGYGICRTLRFRAKTVAKLALASDEELLRLLFRADDSWLTSLLAGLPLKTRTGVPGRGRGLRRIAQSVQRGGLDRLVVIANSGYLDVTLGKSATLAGYGFRGTLVYWEVSGGGGGGKDA